MPKVLCIPGYFFLDIYFFLITISSRGFQTVTSFLGGFQAFSEACPELCYSKTLTAVEPEPPITLGRKTPAYDQVR